MITNEEKDLLDEFLRMLYEDERYEYHSYLYTAIINKGTCKSKYYRVEKINPKRKKTKTLLDEFIELIESKTNVYFTPNTFIKTKNSGRKQSYNDLSNVLYFDLDHIDEIEKIKDVNDIKKYLEKFPVLIEDYFYPSYACLSGHGIHLYFTIETYNLQNHKKTYDDLMMKVATLLNADMKCVDSARLLRIPFSYNAKDEKNLIQTKLFRMIDKDDLDYNIYDLNSLRCHINKYYEMKIDDDQTKKIPKYKIKKSRAIPEKYKVRNARNRNKNNCDFWLGLSKEEKEVIKNRQPKKMNLMERVFYNRVHFLEEILLPYRNYDMLGYRNSFLFIITKLYQNAHFSYTDTLEHCKYVNSRFKIPLRDNDVLNIVYYTFDETKNKNTNIRISNKAIKDMLHILPEEQALDYSISFYDEVREYKQEVATKRSEERKKIQKENSIIPSTMEIKYKHYFEILDQNPNLKTKELAYLMGVTPRQVRNIKAKYLEHKKLSA